MLRWRSIDEIALQNVKSLKERLHFFAVLGLNIKKIIIKIILAKIIELHLKNKQRKKMRKLCKKIACFRLLRKIKRLNTLLQKQLNELEEKSIIANFKIHNVKNGKKYLKKHIRYKPLPGFNHFKSSAIAQRNFFYADLDAADKPRQVDRRVYFF